MQISRKVLITGADGFIGSHLTEALVRAGHCVRAFVLYNSFGTWGWLEHCSDDVKGQFEVVMGDIRDPNIVKEAMAGCDAVGHLAALIAIPYSYRAPHSYVETNVFGTLNVLQAAREVGIRRLVHTSTSEVYGTAAFVPITEQHPLQGQSPYSASKIAADQMAFAYYSSFGLPVVTARPFNTYGPRQSARAVIPTIISQIAAGNRQIQLGSLHPTRDFSFVKDTANAFVRLLETDDANGEVFNFGSNFEVSIGETVKIISETMGAEIEILADKTRIRPTDSEVERLWADNSKALELLQWQPQYSGLDGFKRGIAETVDWFTKSENLARYKSDVYNM